jgi:hypothetical protein
MKPPPPPDSHEKAARAYSDLTLRLVVRDLRKLTSPDLWSKKRLAAMEAELKRRDEGQ